MIKAVFFDLYGTLVGFHPPKEQVQAQALAAFGITVTREGIAQGYVLADHLMSQVNATDAPVPQLAGQDRDRFFAEYEQLILKGAGVEVDLATAGRIWASVRQIPYDFALYDDVLPVLDALGQRGITRGLLTNVGERVPSLVDKLGLGPHLDFSVTSAQAGASKPHPPIFRMALKRAGVTPKEALHVGDSPLSDIEGAKGVGIQPILIDRDGVMAGFDGCPRITGLREVLGYV